MDEKLTESDYEQRRDELLPFMADLTASDEYELLKKGLSEQVLTNCWLVIRSPCFV